MENNKCFKSMKAMLGGVDNPCEEPYSITLAPEQLRKSEVKAYYRPQVVSIGPLHKKTRTDLLYMEEIKWRCTLHLFERSSSNIKKVLADCTSAMLQIDERVRASYNVDKLPFNPNDLAKIMIVDGCFLLELLICGSPNLDTQLRGSSKGLSPGAGVIKREKVLSDLTLLENQIPLGVLFCLFNLLFPPPKLKDEGNRFQLICKLALSIMGYDYTTLVSNMGGYMTLGSGDIKGFHFVELVHSFVHMEQDALEKKIEKENENIDFKIDIDSMPCAARLEAAGVKIQSTGAEPAGVTIQSTVAEPKSTKFDLKISDPKQRLQRCATRLEAAGVTIAIQSTGSEQESTRFDLKVTFQHGKLTIPPLHITETTEAKWRNLIAWELNKSSIGKQRGVHERQFRFQFISYAWFFQSLICCFHDVKLLRERGVIIVQHKGNMSDEDLLEFFQNLTSGVPGGEIDMDSWFACVIQKLNSYRPRMITIKYHATRTSKTIWHKFICYPESCWYFIKAALLKMKNFFFTDWKLRQAGTLIAIVVLILTLLQTIFSGAAL